MAEIKSSCSTCSSKKTLGTIQDSPDSKIERQDKSIATTLSKIKYKLLS